MATPARALDLLNAADSKVKAAAKQVCCDTNLALDLLREASSDLERCRRFEDLLDSCDEVFRAACWWFRERAVEEDLTRIEGVRISGRLSRQREEVLDNTITIVRRSTMMPKVVKVAEELLREPADMKCCAARLHQLGVEIRGSILPRGNLLVSARPRLATELRTKLSALLVDRDDETRCQLALALGEWGGEETVGRLSSIVLSDNESEVLRQFCVAGLKTIGGPQAVRALSALAMEAPPELQYAALRALEELITGGRGDYAIAPDPPSLDPSAEVVRDTISTLQRISNDESQSTRTRQEAREILAELPNIVQ